MNQQYTIGFSSLDESMPSVAYRRETLEQAAAHHPNLKLIVRDNDLNDDKALANAEEFAAIPVDLAIIFHVNERLGPRLGAIFLKKQIPVIAVDVPIPMTTFFGVNNQQAGTLAGGALARWIAANWDNQVDKILVLTEPRSIGIVRERIDYAVKALVAKVPINASNILYLDGASDRTISAQRSEEVLERWRDYGRIAIITVNDDGAHGALDAARRLGLEDHIAVAGQGADAEARAEIRNPASRLIASTDYHMGQYGPRLIDLSLRMLSGERVPYMNFIEHQCVSKV
jgi:ribose transport system substrate-binding protein